MPAYADGTGSEARFWGVNGAVLDSAGNLFVTEIRNHIIRKITPAGVVTTFAGVAGELGSADGIGDAARFHRPFNLAIDSADNLFVADTYNNTIRKITAAGEVTTVAGQAGVAGSQDGIGVNALLNFPTAVAVSSQGIVYVSDTKNEVIRKIDLNGAVSVLAGTVGLAGGSDGTGAAARFRSPFGITTDSAGNVYVADLFNHTIRKITPEGAVTTLAGQPQLIGSRDGQGSAALFNMPYGITVDSAGNVFVTDSRNHTIRKITPGGKVTTLAGAPLVTGYAQGSGNVARFYVPSGITVDRDGSLYIAEFNNSTVRKGVFVPKLISATAGFGGTENRFGFDFNSATGQQVVIEASSDFVNWAPVWTNSQGGFRAEEIQGVTAANRFYRARTP
jgi:sugar lactone lactonase YvrE